MMFTIGDRVKSISKSFHFGEEGVVTSFYNSEYSDEPMTYVLLDGKYTPTSKDGSFGFYTSSLVLIKASGPMSPYQPCHSCGTLTSKKHQHLFGCCECYE